MKQELTDAVNSGDIRRVKKALMSWGKHKIPPSIINRAIDLDHRDIVDELLDADTNISQETSVGDIKNLIAKELNSYSTDDLKILARWAQIPEEEITNATRTDLIDGVSYKLAYVNSPNKAQCVKWAGKISDADLRRLRDKIYNQFKKFKDTVYKMTPDDLRQVFEMYDTEFF